ncbi:hypothetical protein HDV06_003754 [Boothiomyces sp. JEL0866]|nr:hypothetical protein HDV06_003754 [Boothiomyces sp. JEL0866]
MLNPKSIKNLLTSTLKADSETPGGPFTLSKPAPASRIPRQVHNAHFSYVQPSPLPEPKLVSFNYSLAKELGIEYTDSGNAVSTHVIDILSGNKTLEGSNPWALNYGGHQFGSWAGQLGDGRAISLVQFQNDEKLYELQLKGAGLTPYSRFADGYAVVRSSIREYLAAEAMHALGCPTSRSLSLIAGSRIVLREQEEQGAVVCRVLPTWIRLGNFEIFYSRGDKESLKMLADYTIDNFFPDIKDSPKKYYDFISAVLEKTANMIAHWQAVGFCHGVMNTDNFSIIGLTIDYGPFQFLDAYDPFYICNHSDETGRYSFNNQPQIGLWNLVRFASALQPLFEEPTDEVVKELQIIIGKYNPVLAQKYNELMCKKFGFREPSRECMVTIVQPLLVLLQDSEMDYTLFFRSLSSLSLAHSQLPSETLELWKSYSLLPKEAFDTVDPNSETGQSLSTQFSIWYLQYKSAHERSDELARKELMLKSNPRFVPRNYVLQQVIEKAEQGNYEIVNDYLKVLQSPFEEWTEKEYELFGNPVPVKDRDIKCSCSS